MGERSLKPVKIGICGLGTVGSGTVNVLHRNSRVINARAGCDIVIGQVACRRDDVDCDISGLNVTRDIFDVATNPDIDRRRIQIGMRSGNGRQWT